MHFNKEIQSAHKPQNLVLTSEELVEFRLEGFFLVIYYVTDDFILSMESLEIVILEIGWCL